MTICVNGRNMAKLHFKCAVLSILFLFGGLILCYEYMKSRLHNDQIQFNRYTIEEENYMKGNTDLYLITYSNQRYFKALQNLIGSVHFWEPDLRIVIYDIGMNENQVHEILNWKNVLYKKFNFSLYPPHVQKLKNYAFRPIIWNETFHNYGYTFVQDAGQEFIKKIDPIRNIIQKEGFFSSTFEESTLPKFKTLTHPLTEKYLNITLQKPHCEGGIIGFKKDHPRGEDIRKLLHDAAACSLVEECIAPEGSIRDNHFYDQAVLTLLTQKYNFTCGGMKICFVGPDSKIKLTKEPKGSNYDVVICSRGLNGGRQFTQHIMKKQFVLDT